MRQLSLTTGLVILTIVILGSMIQLCCAKPGHLVIPYYQELKEEQELEEIRAQIRLCRNTRIIDRRCEEAFSQEFMLFNDSAKVSSNIVMASLTSMMALIIQRLYV